MSRAWGPALGVHGGPGTLILAVKEKPTAEAAAASERARKLINLPSLRVPRLNISLT